jgi:hypothetical protein
MKKCDIEWRLAKMACDALFFDALNDNKMVLKCLFMIEFYKDLLNEKARQTHCP